MNERYTLSAEKPYFKGVCNDFGVRGFVIGGGSVGVYGGASYFPTGKA